MKWRCAGHLGSVHLSSYHLPSARWFCPLLGRASRCTAGFTISLCLSLNHSHSHVCEHSGGCVRVCVHVFACILACVLVLSHSVLHVNLWYVEHFEGIYHVIAVPPSQCAKYMKLSDPLTRHLCIIVREVEEYHSHIHHYHIRHCNPIFVCVICT